MKLPKLQIYFTVLIVLFLFIMPTFMHSPRYISLSSATFLNIILAMGVYSLYSVGLINAAQPAFFGFGAYTVAILMTRFHWPFWLVFPLAGVIPATIAAIFGWIGLRLKGAYFLFVTIAFCELMIWVFQDWKSVFGGSFGIFPIPQPEIRIFGLTVFFSVSLTPYYYLSLIVALVTCLVYFRIHGSRLGRVWECVNSSEGLVANMGISVFYQKLICLSASCFFAGLAGAIYAPFMKIASAGQVSLWQGIWIVLGALVGGIFSPVGAIIGTVFMAVIGVLLQGFLQVQPLVLGIILMLTLLFMPSGLLGGPALVRKKILELTANKDADRKKML